jgi:hypothetical protein
LVSPSRDYGSVYGRTTNQDAVFVWNYFQPSTYRKNSGVDCGNTRAAFRAAD